jgi:hypothetical protein
MYMSMNTIEKIKKALNAIIDNLPIDSDKLIEMFMDLTMCELEYDIYPRIEKTEKLSDNIDLRIYNAYDKVYCVENGIEKEYIVNAKVIDIFDKYKTIAMIVEYKVLNIEQVR